MDITQATTKYVKALVELREYVVTPGGRGDEKLESLVVHYNEAHESLIRVGGYPSRYGDIGRCLFTRP